MEVQVSPQTQKLNFQTPSHESSLIRHQKDLWFAIQEGIVADVDSTFVLLKKSGCNVNLRNAYGLTPFHIGTWRNHIPIVRRFLAAGAYLDARDDICFRIENLDGVDFIELCILAILTW